MDEVRPRGRADGLIVQELDGELLVYDLDRHQAHCLNASLARVFEQSDGTAGAHEIAAALGCDPEIVHLAHDELSKLGLLEDGLPEKTLSRRSLLKRAGVVAVALPAAASVAVPAAYAAGSCIPEGDGCFFNGQPQQDCCPGLTCCDDKTTATNFGCFDPSNCRTS